MKQNSIPKTNQRAAAIVRLALATIIATTLGLTACQSQLDELTPDHRPIVSLNVTMPGEAQTRVAYDGTTSALKWQADDKLTVSRGGETSTFSLTSADGYTAATFTGKEPAGTGPFSIAYQPTGDATAAQVQTGNNNTDHLSPYFTLGAEDVTSLTEPVKLHFNTALFRFIIKNRPTELGIPKSLQWSSQTAAGIRTITLGLDDVTPDDDGSITAHIAFLPTEMSLASGGTFSITLTGADGTTISTSTTSVSGKTYAAGKRYTVMIGTGDGELPLRPKYVEGNGEQSLDKNKFNQDVPKWVINGGGTTEKNDAVLKNVIEAFNKLSNIELTLTGVTGLPDYAFYNNSFGYDALASASLPKVTSIGKWAFAVSSNLTRLELTAAGTITLDDKAFFHNFTTTNCTLVLNPDKKPGGAGLPKVDADGKTWGGKPWKAIEYTAAPATRQ